MYIAMMAKENITRFSNLRVYNQFQYINISNNQGLYIQSADSRGGYLRSAAESASAGS